MAKKTTKQWSESDYEYLTKNISHGTVKLSTHFGVSLAVIRRRCSLLGIELKLNKAEIKPIKETKMDNGEQFDKSRHKIKNNSTEGKIPFYIKSEKMTVYLKPEQNNDKYKQSVIKRYANRHKPIV